MPNQPDTNNRNLCIRVTRELYYKVRREARRRGMDMAEFVRHVLNEEVLTVQLSADEIRQIAQEVHEAEIKRNKLR